LLLFSLPVVPP
jgi:hypothetical protein